jgi:hypothetical protein
LFLALPARRRVDDLKLTSSLWTTTRGEKGILIRFKDVHNSIYIAPGGLAAFENIIHETVFLIGVFGIWKKPSSPSGLL